MTLGECQKKITHREYLAWMDWFDFDMNRPSKIDYYLMQIAAEVRRVLASNRNAIKMDNFKITFKRRDEAKSQAHKDTLAQWAKARWLGAVASFRSKKEKK